MQETSLSQNWNLQPNAILSGKVAENFTAKEYKKSVLLKISSAQYACQPGLGSTDATIYTLVLKTEFFPKPLTPCHQGNYSSPSVSGHAYYGLFVTHPSCT